MRSKGTRLIHVASGVLVHNISMSAQSVLIACSDTLS